MARALSLFLFLLLLSGSTCAAKSWGLQVRTGQVRFTLHAPSAKSVALAGSFNRWDWRSHSLSGPDRKGFWNITLRLPGGRYEYLFVVDGKQWVADPSAPEMGDGFGGRNSVVDVP